MDSATGTVIERGTGFQSKRMAFRGVGRTFLNQQFGVFRTAALRGLASSAQGRHGGGVVAPGPVVIHAERRAARALGGNEGVASGRGGTRSMTAREIR